MSLVKILHVIPTYLPATRYGGTIYASHGLCRAQAEAGHEVHVYTTNVDGLSVSDVPLVSAVNLDGVNVWYFATSAGRRIYRSPAMRSMMKKSIGSFDVVHLHSVFLWPTWAAARLAKSAGVPYVLSPHGMLVKDLVKRKSRLIKSLWIRFIEARNLRFASLVHFTSQIEQDEFDAFRIGIKRSCLIPNGVELYEAGNASFTDDKVEQAVSAGPYILYFGRLNWKKGLDRLLVAIQQIPDIRLLIVGNDEENYLNEIAPLLNVAELKGRVTVISRFITGADKVLLFRMADIFALPSYSENFGITVIEAMANGCPVVVTREVGAAELVERAGGGLVTDNAGLSGTLSTLLNDELMRSAMGNAGAKWVAENLTWNQISSSMVNEYTVLKGNSR